MTPTAQSGLPLSTQLMLQRNSGQDCSTGCVNGHMYCGPESCVNSPRPYHSEQGSFGMDDTANTPTPYRPSNGWEGANFEARFCDQCERQKAFNDAWENYVLGGGDNLGDVEGCNILTTVHGTQVDDPAYPKEWIEGATGPRCTAFTSALPTRERTA